MPESRFPKSEDERAARGVDGVANVPEARSPKFAKSTLRATNLVLSTCNVQNVPSVAGIRKLVILSLFVILLLLVTDKAFAREKEGQRRSSLG